MTKEGSKSVFNWTVEKQGSQKEGSFSTFLLGHPNIGCGQLRDNGEIGISVLQQVWAGVDSRITSVVET